jgi:hypothetical protein
VAGSTIKLAGATLRSSAIELSGQGGGSIPKEVLQKIPTTILPEIFRLAAEGILTVDTEIILSLIKFHKHDISIHIPQFTVLKPFRNSANNSESGFLP